MKKPCIWAWSYRADASETSGAATPLWIEDGNICENKRYLYQEILCRTWTWYAKRRRGLKRLKSIANLLNHICLNIPAWISTISTASICTWFVCTYIHAYLNIDPVIQRYIDTHIIPYHIYAYAPASAYIRRCLKVMSPPVVGLLITHLPILISSKTQQLTKSSLRTLFITHPSRIISSPETQKKTVHRTSKSTSEPTVILC